MGKSYNYQVVIRQIHDTMVTFLIEATKTDYKYFCTIEDVVVILSSLPKEDVELIELIIFRQPKNKETILNPAWGRLAYYAHIDQYCGAAIIIEAVNIYSTLR